MTGQQAELNCEKDKKDSQSLQSLLRGIEPRAAGYIRMHSEVFLKVKTGDVDRYTTRDLCVDCDHSFQK